MLTHYPIGPMPDRLLSGGQIRLDLRRQSEEVSQNQLGEELEFFGLLFRWLGQVVDRFITFKADLVCPVFQVLCDKTVLFKLVNSLAEVVNVNSRLKDFGSDVNRPSKHHNSGTIATVYSVLAAFYKGIGGRVWHIFRSKRLSPDWEYLATNSHIDSRVISQVSFQVSGRDKCHYLCDETYGSIASWAATQHVPPVVVPRVHGGATAIETSISSAAMRAIMNEDSHG